MNTSLSRLHPVVQSSLWREREASAKSTSAPRRDFVFREELRCSSSQVSPPHPEFPLREAKIGSAVPPRASMNRKSLPCAENRHRGPKDRFHEENLATWEENFTTWKRISPLGRELGSAEEDLGTAEENFAARSGKTVERSTGRSQ
jgi:hypothetical protein